MRAQIAPAPWRHPSNHLGQFVLIGRVTDPVIRRCRKPIERAVFGSQAVVMALSTLWQESESTGTGTLIWFSRGTCSAHLNQ